MTNSACEWHHTFYHHIFSLLWPTVWSEWHCTFVKASLSKSFPMTHREWVICTFYPHSFLWPTPGGEWHWTFCERQSHHIFPHVQQFVSNIAHYIITSFPTMTNSKWATLHSLWKAVSSQFVPLTNGSLWVTLHILSSHLFLCPTECEWSHCTFCQRKSHYPMTTCIASKWLQCTFCATCKAVSSHLFLWPGSK